MNGSDFIYVFIVDRSGSMEGNRMQKAKEAMDLFLRSMPENCMF